MINRRGILTGAAGMVGVGAFGRSAFAKDRSMRIGLISQMSGFAQQHGAANNMGAQIAADYINKQGGVNGAKVEIVVRDDKGTTDGAVAAYRDLTAEGIRFIVGGPSSGPAIAVAPLVAGSEVIFVASGSSSMSITHELFNENVFRNGYTGKAWYAGLTLEVARANPGVLKWVSFATDSATMIDNTRYIAEGLKKNYQALHGQTIEIADPILTKAGTSDFTNLLSEFARSEATGLLIGNFGADEIAFFKQLRAFGIDKKFSVIVDNSLELQLVRALGSDIPRNIWSPTQGFKDDKNPLSVNLHNEVVARSNSKFPYGFAWHAHDAVIALAAGVVQAGSYEVAAVRAAMVNGSPAGASGPVVYRKEDHAYMGACTFLNFGSEPASESGWRIHSQVALDMAQFLEEPTPGVKFPG